MYSNRANSTQWVSGGSFSAADYDGSVVTTGHWADYSNPQPELVFDVTDQVASMYDAGENYGLTMRGSYDIIAYASEGDLSTYRPVLEISYYYEQTGYTLTVNSGSGSRQLRGDHHRRDRRRSGGGRREILGLDGRHGLSGRRHGLHDRRDDARTGSHSHSHLHL